MKNKVRESTVVDNIRKKALELHFPGFYFKSHGGLYQVAGLPDLIGVHKGRFIGIEVKAPGKEKTLTEKQKQVLNKITASGGIAFMASSPEEVISKLKEEFENGKESKGNKVNGKGKKAPRNSTGIK